MDKNAIDTTNEKVLSKSSVLEIFKTFQTSSSDYIKQYVLLESLLSFIYNRIMKTDRGPDGSDVIVSPLKNIHSNKLDYIVSNDLILSKLKSRYDIKSDFDLLYAVMSSVSELENIAPKLIEKVNSEFDSTIKITSSDPNSIVLLYYTTLCTEVMYNRPANSLLGLITKYYMSNNKILSLNENVLSGILDVIYGGKDKSEKVKQDQDWSMYLHNFVTMYNQNEVEKHVEMLGKIYVPKNDVAVTSSIFSSIVSRFNKFFTGLLEYFKHVLPDGISAQSGFIGNPIYHIRKFLVDRDVERFEALKEEKAYILMKLQFLNDAMSDTIDDGKKEKILKEIEYYGNRLNKVNNKIDYYIKLADEM